MIIPNMVLKHMNLPLQIIFFGALVSAILSTTSSAIMAPAVVLGENIFKFFRSKASTTAIAENHPYRHYRYHRRLHFYGRNPGKHFRTGRRIFGIQPGVIVCAAGSGALLEIQQYARLYTFDGTRSGYLAGMYIY
jgi:hypothetical protein